MTRHSLDQALRLVNEGKYSEALIILDSLVNSENDKNARGHRAWLYRHLGKYQEALADYEKLENNLDARALAAECLFKLGEINKALLRSLEVLNKDSSNCIAVKTIYKCQMALGVEEFEKENQLISTVRGKSAQINSVVSALEEDTKSFPTSVHPPVGLLLYALVRSLKPELVIETGSFIGYSSLCISQALEDNGQGVLHSFDLFSEVPPNYISPILGEMDSLYDIANGHINKSGLQDRVVFHAGNSSDSINELFKDRENILDLAFIDGDHTIKGCLKDWHAVDKLLKPGAIVVLHDTLPNGCDWLGPHNLLGSLENKEKANYRWINLPTYDEAGLGIIQKLSHLEHSQLKPALLDLIHERFFHDNQK